MGIERKRVMAMNGWIEKAWNRFDLIRLIYLILLVGLIFEDTYYSQSSGPLPFSIPTYSFHNFS